MTQSTTEVPRIDSLELQHHQKGGKPLHIIDVRRGSYRNSPVKIRDALRVDPDDLLMAEHIELPVAKDALVVTYCTWPNEGTSARVAQKLRDQGYDARALRGGFEAWEEASGAVEDK